MDPSWIEFLSERETVKIVPNFTQPTLHLLAGDVGPFKAGIPLEVPLWVGLNLRQRQKCRFVQPEWMNVDVLEEAKETERTETMLTKLPHDYMFVMAQQMLDVAEGDISQSDAIRIVIKDIWDMRQSKLRYVSTRHNSVLNEMMTHLVVFRRIVDSFVQSGSLRATLNNVHAIELNQIRPLLPHTLDQIARLEMAASEVKRSTQGSQNITDRSLNASSSLY